MPKYVDGFVVPVPKKKLQAYRALAKKAGKIFIELGALEYRECVGEHLDVPFATPFTRGVRSKRGETVVFSWIGYRSRKHRDQVNARMMKDERMQALCDPKNTPFDMNRMLYGGFETIVSY